jgi:hypothetical protein
MRINGNGDIASSIWLCRFPTLLFLLELFSRFFGALLQFLREWLPQKLRATSKGIIEVYEFLLPRTTYRCTAKGRQEFERYIDQMESMIKGLR